MLSCVHPTEKKEYSPQKKILPGAYQTNEYIPLLNGKKVGVVANQSSLIGVTHLVDSLLKLQIDIVKVFSPEHGFRGDADAGEHIENQKDSKTGIPIISLYGKNKKPTNAQLKDIDVIVFDLQDVGVRFYTYISTLHYVLQACGENHIPVIVLDRPNPNGHYIDGPVLKEKFQSFVGMHPVPVVYGMTIGEYAKMILGENWISLKENQTLNLTVIPCKNYTHSSPYHLPVAPSPNLKSDLAIALYPSLCFFEGTTVSVGRGTDFPFECYGHPHFPETGFSFIPLSKKGAKYPKHKGTKCNGYHLNEDKYMRMNRLDLSFLLNANKLLKNEEWINRPRFLDLLAGNDTLRQQILSGKSEKEIRETWKKDIESFKIIREKYLIYR